MPRVQHGCRYVVQHVRQALHVPALWWDDEVHVPSWPLHHAWPGLLSLTSCPPGLAHMQVSISGQALVFVVRTQGYSIVNKAGGLTYAAFILAQVLTHHSPG